MRYFYINLIQENSKNITIKIMYVVSSLFNHLIIILLLKYSLCLKICLYRLHAH